MQNQLPCFPKIHCRAILGGHLEFMCKTNICIYHGNNGNRAIEPNFGLDGVCKIICPFFNKKKKQKTKKKMLSHYFWWPS